MNKPSINANRCKLSELYIPLSYFLESDTLRLRAVETKYRYNEDKNAAKEIEGYKYTLIDAATYQTFDVVVDKMEKAIITQEDLNKLGINFPYVTIPLEETLVHTYGYEKGYTNMKITCPHIKLVKESSK